MSFLLTSFTLSRIPVSSLHSDNTIIHPSQQFLIGFNFLVLQATGWGTIVLSALDSWYLIHSRRSRVWLSVSAD